MQTPPPSTLCPATGPTVIADVARVSGSGGTVRVTCATINGGSAEAGSDYTTVSTELVWLGGDTHTKSCIVPITNDGAPEMDETINLVLVNPAGGAHLGTPAAAVIRITDNDGVGATVVYPGAPTAIPDTNTTLSLPLVVTGAPSPIIDVNAFLHVHHTWVGDLIIRVRSPRGTSVYLIVGPGAATSSDYGCSGDDIEAIFDDAASSMRIPTAAPAPASRRVRIAQSINSPRSTVRIPMAHGTSTSRIERQVMPAVSRASH